MEPKRQRKELDDIEQDLKGMKIAKIAKSDEESNATEHFAVTKVRLWLLDSKAEVLRKLKSGK